MSSQKKCEFKIPFSKNVKIVFTTICHFGWLLVNNLHWANIKWILAFSAWPACGLLANLSNLVSLFINFWSAISKRHFFCFSVKHFSCNIAEMIVNKKTSIFFLMLCFPANSNTNDKLMMPKQSVKAKKNLKHVTMSITSKPTISADYFPTTKTVGLARSLAFQCGFRLFCFCRSSHHYVAVRFFIASFISI